MSIDAMKKALEYLGDEAPVCSGCAYEWEQAIKVLKDAVLAADDALESFQVTSKLGDICSFRSSNVKKGDLIYTHQQPDDTALLKQALDAMNLVRVKQTIGLDLPEADCERLDKAITALMERLGENK